MPIKPHGIKMFVVLKFVESLVCAPIMYVFFSFAAGTGANLSLWPPLVMNMTLLAGVFFLYVTAGVHLWRYQTWSRRLMLGFDGLWGGYLLFFIFRSISYQSLGIIAGAVIFFLLHFGSLFYFVRPSVKAFFAAQPQFPIKSFFLKFTLAAILIFGLSNYWYQGWARKELQSHFLESFGSKYLAGSKILDGYCTHWMDTFIALIFTTSKENMAEILKGFQPCVYPEINSHQFSFSRYKKDLQETACYEKEEQNNYFTIYWNADKQMAYLSVMLN